MSYIISIEETVNNVVVSPPPNNTVSVNNTNYPITISYNSTIDYGGGGNVSVSESQPATASTGDQWFRESTQVLQVYTGTAWTPISVDDLQY